MLHRADSYAALLEIDADAIDYFGGKPCQSLVGPPVFLTSSEPSTFTASL